MYLTSKKLTILNFEKIGLVEDEVSLEEIRKVWRNNIIKQRVTLVALVDEENDKNSKPRIAGVNMLSINEKGSPPVEVRVLLINIYV